jgi:hypothetical protein
LVGRFQSLVVESDDFRTDPALTYELLVGNKKVDQRTKKLVDAVQGVTFFPGILAPIGDIVSDESVIFLFGETVIVFVVRTAAGEAEGFDGLLPVDGVVVDKLRAVVAEELDDVEGAAEAGGL